MTAAPTNNPGIRNPATGPDIDNPKKPATRNLIGWFGSKGRLADTIVEELGDHRAYFDPACGGLSVLYAKSPCSHETVNDLHGDLINLAMVLASDYWEDLHARLSRSLCCEGIHGAARAVFAQAGGDAGSYRAPAAPSEVTADDLERAYWYFIISWLGRKGTGGTPNETSGRLAVRWTANGGGTALRWQSAIAGLPWWHARLQNVTILQRDLFDVLGKIADHAGTAIYVDPPYLLDTRGGHRYTHDLTDADQTALAESLNRFREARVVVSYYDSPRLAEMFPGWTLRPLRAHKANANAAKRKTGRAAAPEVLVINGPSLAETPDSPRKESHA